MSKDLLPILDGWDYRPGQVTVRKVAGVDGSEKIQMRLQLGLLQMEAEGRPDGKRPYDHESLLDYFLEILTTMEAENRADQFSLSAQDCSELRDESLEYYYRYLSLFHLEDYEGVARDTERNLKALDLIKNYAKTDADKYSLEQYRPYILMMNARAYANLAMQENDLNSAYSVLQDGMEDIMDFFRDFGQPGLATKSDEYKSLAEQARELKDRLPRDPLDVLRDKLDAAVREERFEDAARLRDKIERLEKASIP